MAVTLTANAIGANGSVNITSPINGATVTSPFHCVASATSTYPVTLLQIYVDYKLAYTVSGSRLDTYLSLTSGSHRFVVQAKDSAGNFFKKAEKITVGGTTSSVSVAVSPTTDILAVSKSQQFSSTVSGTTNTGVVWLVNGVQGGSSTLGSITSSGFYTAPPAVPTNSTVSVTAKSVADTTKSASASVTISSSSNGVAVSLSPSSATVTGGSSQQFTATVSGTYNTGVIWSVNGVQGGNDTIGTISTTGLYTAPSCPSAASVSVSAASAYDSSISSTSQVTLSTSTSTTTHFVAVTGNDGNPGSACAPWATLQHAADSVNPGDTVIVEDGTYSNSAQSGSGSRLVDSTRGGTSTAYVIFRAEHKWGAVLDGLNNTTAEGWTFESGANYIRVQDFDIQGFSDDGFSNYGGGKYIQIVGNQIHHMGRYCTDTGIGRDGIFINAGPVLIDRNEIHDIGRFSPGENGCTMTTTYYQHNDHAIYIGSGNGVTVSNNIFYNNVHGWSVHVYPNSVDSLTVAGNTFAVQNPYAIGFIILAGPAITNSRITDNIFDQPNTAAIYRYTGSTPTSDSVAIQDNISTNKMLLLYSTNMIDATYSGVTYASNQESTDPLLVSPSTFDFHLNSGSPAVNAGVSVVGMTTDFNGTTRSSPPSIGGYEYLSKP